MSVPLARSAALAIGSLALALVGGHPALGVTRGQHSGRPVDRAEEVGRWQVRPAGPSEYQLTWYSPTRIPTTDAVVQIRHDGISTTARVARDASAVSVMVASASPPDPSSYHVVLGSQVLDRPGSRSGGQERIAHRPTHLVPSVRKLLADPGKPGTHAVTSTDYQLAPVKVPDIKQLSEMVGHVVTPVDATNHSPLVVFLHGRHGACYGPDLRARLVPHAKVWSCPAGQKPVPSYLGYDYVQRLLASQGYVTVSISADAINDLDFQAQDGGAAARAALIRDHLRAWVGFAGSGEHPADLSDVVLVGHSRGGEGVDRASQNLPTDEGYRVTGQVLIGPTDFAFQAAPAMPTVTILPYCDGDVSDLEGQNFIDDARDVTQDPTHDLAFHSAVLVMGADHNFFNTEWTPGLSKAPSVDDWFGKPTAECGTKSGTRLTAAGERRVGQSYIAGAVHLFAKGDRSVLPMFDGSPVAPPSAGGADVRSHAIGGGQVTVRPGLDGSPTAHATADVRLCLGVSDSDDAASCKKHLGSLRTPHWPSALWDAGVALRQFLEVGWQASGQQGGLDLDQPWDLGGDIRLDLRTIVDPRVGPVRLGISLTDADGHSVVLTPVGGGNLDPLPRGGFSLAKRWAQDLRVSLAGVSGVDLSRITHVGLVSKNASGRVFVADISATPTAGVSTLPTTALPVLSIDTVRQPEGDGTAPVTVDVPWHVTGDLDHQATVAVVHSTPFNFDQHPVVETLVIPPHTPGGVLHVQYQPNVIDDTRTHLLGLTAYPVSGIETDRYVGGASVVDDDPEPRLTLRAKARRIASGDKASWTLRLGSPVGYDLYVPAKPVRRVDGPQLRVGDLPKRFRERNLGDKIDLDTPLYKSALVLTCLVRAGRTTGSLSLPTRREHGTTRWVSLRFRVPHFELARPIRTVKVGR
jgi:hypothetical protein